MIVVVGGRASGKRTYVKSMGYAEGELADGVLDERPVLLNLQDLLWSGCGFADEHPCGVGAGSAGESANGSPDAGCADSAAFALARDPQQIAELLADKQIVTCCEVGNGIVPIDPAERAWRECVGRTLTLLADRADSVVRMVCGIPVILK